MSNTLDVGPMQIMKRAIDLASQPLGATTYSGSTLSLFRLVHKSAFIKNLLRIENKRAHQGIVPWEKS
jgi:hypothetical protein